MKRPTLSFLIALCWLIVSTILFTLPGTAFPKEDWLSKIWFDKWVHIGLFAILVFLWCYALKNIEKGKLKKLFILIFILSLAYGIAMEYVQKYFIVNRSFDEGDIIADAIGSFIGLAYCWKRYIKN